MAIVKRIDGRWLSDGCVYLATGSCHHPGRQSGVRLSPPCEREETNRRLSKSPLDPCPGEVLSIIPREDQGDAVSLGVEAELSGRLALRRLVRYAVINWIFVGYASPVPERVKE